ncbi:hypothetical protein ABFA07_012925 [Porites harrisoni]
MKICCASLICLLLVVAVVSSSVVPFNREEQKRDVTNHAPQMDIITGPYLPQFLRHYREVLIKLTDKILQGFIRS